jgi:hypothetical protein
MHASDEAPEPLAADLLQSLARTLHRVLCAVPAAAASVLGAASALASASPSSLKVSTRFLRVMHTCYMLLKDLRSCV